MEEEEKWFSAKAYFEDLFDQNPPKPMNQHKASALLFMLNIFKEYSYIYKEIVESHLSGLQDTNANDLEIRYFQKLYEQWAGLESAFSNTDCIQKELEESIL